MPWKYIAVRMNGDGTETILDLDVPISGVAIRRDLSGPSQFTGNIGPAVRRLQVKVNGESQPLFVPWSTAIFPEKDGVIRHGYLVADLIENGPDLSIDAVGFGHYPKGMPWTGEEFTGVQVDPLDMVRRIWEHLQTFYNGNLGLRVDDTTSPVRVGTDLEIVELEDRTFEAGPFKLSHYQTHDLGKVIEDLAAKTPFDFREHHYWDPDDDRRILHRMELAYPRIGERRHNLRFVVGENIFTQPSVEYDGEEFADEVVVLGSGEGRDMVRSDPASRVTGRLRRVAMIVRKDITTKRQANELAAFELKRRLGNGTVSSIVVTEHGHAPLGSFDLGDEIAVGTTAGWSDGRDFWVRVVAISLDPVNETATLTVIQAEAV